MDKRTLIVSVAYLSVFAYLFLAIILSLTISFSIFQYMIVALFPIAPLVWFVIFVKQVGGEGLKAYKRLRA